jgi:hypothetical protein
VLRLESIGCEIVLGRIYAKVQLARSEASAGDQYR